MSNCPDCVPLGNLISVLSGFPFASAQFTEGIGKPLIRIRDLIGSRTETRFTGDFDPAFLIRYDDVLIGMDGDFTVVRWKGPEALLNQRVCKVSSASDELDERFLFWWLKPHIQIVHRRTPQTTVRHLSVGDVYRIPKPVLGSKAQAIAAAALDTVDEGIAKTKAVIAKLRQVRAGLFLDLLTRGLDKNGQLRDPIAHPEQFKNSSLGRIPVGWSCGGLGDFIDLIVGPAFESSRFSKCGDGVRLLRGLNVTRGHVRWGDGITERWPLITPDLAIYQLEVGDVVIGMDEALVGRNVAALTTGDAPSILVQRVARIRGLPRLKTAYAYLLLTIPSFLRHVDTRKTQTAIPHITACDIREYPVAVPDPDEQQLVLNIVVASDSEIKTTENELTKLESLKAGLVTDLLTGRVRVPTNP